MSVSRPKLGRVAASLLPLLLLLALQGAPTRSNAADHGGDRRRTAGPGELQALGTTTAASEEAQLLSRSEEKTTKKTWSGPGYRRPATSHGEGSGRNLDDVRLEFVDIEMLFDEPPPLTNPVPDAWVQRCSNLNASSFAHGATCGSPLTEPCFERGRCETGGGGVLLPKIYVYDQEVCC